jgi:hypothetical protein
MRLTGLASTVRSRWELPTEDSCGGYLHSDATTSVG